MKQRQKIIFYTLGIVLVFCSPWIFVQTSTRKNTHTTIDTLPTSDVVIIFWTLVNESGAISPLLKERLEGGKMIYDAGKTQKIVVSNTPFAASVMKDYLAEKWVASWDIYLDTWAVTTVDTCLFEKQQHPNWRSAIFVSQGFHIPRVVYQCHREWVQWVGLVVDRLGIIDRSQYTPWTKLRIRSGRFFREALFDWAAILKIY